MKPRISRTVVTVPPRPREGMSQRHVADVGSLPCLACGSLAGVHCHHLLRTGEHGVSRKSSDQWGIPLCAKCHDPREAGSLHHSGNEEAWLAERGIDGRAIARCLWTERGDRKRMMRIVIRSLNLRGVFVNV